MTKKYVNEHQLVIVMEGGHKALFVCRDKQEAQLAISMLANKSDAYPYGVIVIYYDNDECKTAISLQRFLFAYAVESADAEPGGA